MRDEAPPAVIWRWDGEAMHPSTPRQLMIANAGFVVGCKYALAEYSERSARSHRFYFATIRELWLNMPESLSPQYPNPEVLRKHALIRCGYANKEQLVCRSNADAMRVAAFLKPADEYAIIEVNGAVVTRWTAQSQNMRAMDRATFQESKSAVLDWIADQVGVTAQDAARMVA